jgi:hypothetical protein
MSEQIGKIERENTHEMVGMTIHNGYVDDCATQVDGDPLLVVSVYFEMYYFIPVGIEGMFSPPRLRPSIKTLRPSQLLRHTIQGGRVTFYSCPSTNIRLKRLARCRDEADKKIGRSWSNFEILSVVACINMYVDRGHKQMQKISLVDRLWLHARLGTRRVPHGVPKVASDEGKKKVTPGEYKESLEGHASLLTYDFTIVGRHLMRGFNCSSKAPRIGLWSDEAKSSMGSYASIFN